MFPILGTKYYIPYSVIAKLIFCEIFLASKNYINNYLKSFLP